MIQFRVGQSWKREPAGPPGPRDAFALEVDGVNLLPGATEEPLVKVVAGLVDSVAGLVVDGERSGELSLEDVSLEVCLWRRPGLDVEVAVLSLAQPPRRAQPTVTVELPALVEATAQCARGLLRELGEPLPAEALRLKARLSELSLTVVREWPERAVEPWTASHQAEGLGYRLADLDGRSTSFTRRSPGGLPALLIDGAVSWGSSECVEGLPFLTMLGLARAAGQGRVPFLGRELEPTWVFETGLDLCLTMRTRNPALASNPWLEALQTRCAEGLRALKAPLPDTSARTRGPAHERGPAPDAPLPVPGDVRRVALAPQWTQPVALGEEGARLLLGRSAIVVASPDAAHAFTPRGRAAFQHLSPRGVATSANHTLCATSERVLLFEGGARSASWLKDHDGSRIGPGLHATDGALVTTLARRGVVAFDPATGRERWRFEPPRTQRVYLTFSGARVLVATDGGVLFGLDAQSGQVRFTVRSTLPFAGPVVSLGQRAIAVLRRAELTAVYLCQALASGARAPAGTVTWTHEVALSNPGTPVATKGRIFLTGQRDGQSLVVALSTSGHLLWERQTALDPSSQLALAFDGGLVVTDARGNAVRLLPNGETAWVLGSQGDQLSSPIAPVLRRHVLIIPGPTLRLVEPRGGRVLGELDTGPRVVDVAVDRTLAVFVLKEPGLLEAWRPAAVLALVEGHT